MGHAFDSRHGGADANYSDGLHHHHGRARAGRDGRSEIPEGLASNVLGEVRGEGDHGDRRKGGEDRRNAERVAEDPVPRRDPERTGRRKTDLPPPETDH